MVCEEGCGSVGGGRQEGATSRAADVQPGGVEGNMSGRGRGMIGL